ncbi:hypothetical protein B0H17DRAFT_932420 [Mycena rosella]|uniref:Major facilitator superfamily (MFS) profile domain-containing protein n=1 Tax=Mycena rosella TaxID=1033263 RepID=A0AAD7GGQ6_MYCRO|nr:hypothetical protein B0H17DRAFT_932420 [Mycena rosella]
MSEKDSSGKLELSPEQIDEPAPLHTEPPVPLYKVHNVLNTDLALALSTGPQLKPLSVQAFKLYLVILVSFMGSLSFGFDSSVVSGVNGMTQFTDYFGIGGGATGGGQGIITGMLFSIFSLGVTAGSFIAGPVADKWGRRGGMLIASVLILAGVSTVTAAQSRIYLFFGRFFIGFGTALNNSAAPAYVAEMSPPQWRGRLAGLTVAIAFVGSIVCSGVVIATGRINSSLAWRLPFAFQFVPTIFLASPRWLISVGRKEEARQILAKYHGNGDGNSPLVVLEWHELETHIKLDGSDKRWWDYSELSNSRGARYRTFSICWLALCYQWSGTGILSVRIFLEFPAAVKTQQNRLVFSFVSVALAGFGGLVGALVVDRLGRRTLWLWGSALTAAALAFTAGKFPYRCSSKGLPTVTSSFVINMTFTPLLGKGYSSTIGKSPSRNCTFPADGDARSKGLALFALVQSLSSLVNNFAGAVAFERIGWKYMLVPAIWDVVEMVVVWFCAVETKGRTLYVPVLETPSAILNRDVARNWTRSSRFGSFFHMMPSLKSCRIGIRSTRPWPGIGAAA